MGIRFAIIHLVAATVAATLLSCSRGDYSDDWTRIVRVDLSRGAATPADGGINPGDANVVVLQITVTAGTDEQVRVHSLRFTETGSGDEQNEITGIGLYLDADGDGAYSPAVDTVNLTSVAGGYSAAGTIDLTGIDRIVHPGGTENWILVHDFSAAAALGSAFTPILAFETDVAASGGESGRGAVISGPAVTGRTVTVGAGTSGPPVDVTELTPPGGTQVNQIASETVLLHLRFANNGAEGARVNSVSFQAQGSGIDDQEVTSVCLFVDTNSDGVLQRATDPPVSGDAWGYKYSGDNGIVNFTALNHVIPVGSSSDFILVYYMAAPQGPNFRVRFDPATDVTAVGAVSGGTSTVTGGSVNGPQIALMNSPAWMQDFASAPVGYAGEHGHSAVFDPVNNRIILFGGVTGMGPENNDTWQIDLSASPATWTQLSTGPPPSLPPARHGHTAVYVPPNSGLGGAPQMLVFGGWSSGTAVNDLWTLDLTLGSEGWTALSPSSPPAARCYHAAAWDDTADNMILYGGAADLPPHWGTGPVQTLFNDVAYFDPSGAAWTSVSPSGTPPSGTGRAGHSMVFDDKSGRYVVFGGCDYTTGGAEVYFNDIYSLDSVSWTWGTLSSSGNAPTARYLHSAVVDTIGRRMFVFGGGQTTGVGTGSVTNDVFVYNLNAANDTWATGPWLLLPTTGGPPTARYNHAGAYDSTGMRAFWFSGQGVTDAWDYR
ncbi:MAG: Kelch repeat-containing protein [Planctomycetota bacterium]|jgi:N-acetylneuraminic acid mutarotase